MKAWQFCIIKAVFNFKIYTYGEGDRDRFGDYKLGGGDS
jgi:hypothetical protein